MGCCTRRRDATDGFRPDNCVHTISVRANIEACKILMRCAGSPESINDTVELPVVEQDNSRDSPSGTINRLGCLSNQIGLRLLAYTLSACTCSLGFSLCKSCVWLSESTVPMTADNWLLNRGRNM